MNMNKTKNVTLEDVAEVAGVSRATVSRVVRNIPDVDPAIAHKVNKAIKKTGYVVNTAARTLAGGKTNNIGIVFREHFGDIFQNGHWGQVLEGVYSVLSGQGYQITPLINIPEYEEQVKAYVTRQHLDGVIVLSTSTKDYFPAQLQAAGFPVVVFGKSHKSASIASIVHDDFKCGELAATHLVESGVTSFAVITGTEIIKASEERLDGFRSKLKEHGVQLLTSQIVSGEFTQARAYDATKKLLQKSPKTDGIFVLSDLMATGVLEALHESGRKVPRDIQLVSVDNSPTSLFTNPRLSSFDTQAFEAGRTSAEMLIELMAGRPIKRITFEATLVQRESTKNKENRATTERRMKNVI